MLLSLFALSMEIAGYWGLLCNGPNVLLANQISRATETRRGDISSPDSVLDLGRVRGPGELHATIPVTNHNLQTVEIKMLQMCSCLPPRTHFSIMPGETIDLPVIVSLRHVTGQFHMRIHVQTIESQEQPRAANRRFLDHAKYCLNRIRGLVARARAVLWAA